MQFIWENLIGIIFIIFTAENVFGTGESSLFKRELKSYSKACNNATCGIKLTVDNEATTKTPPIATDLAAEMSRLKGLLVNLSTALHRDTIATASTLNRLQNNITYLHMAMNKLISVVNYTLADQTQLKVEMAEMKSNLSALMAAFDGKTQNGQILVTRPQLLHKDFTEAVGTDCAALYLAGSNVSGIYTLQPDYRNGSYQFQVYCDMDHDGGGWTVIQRRIDGSDDFFRGWQSYKRGFGGLLHDFWLGLDNIHTLTKHGNTKMRISLLDWDNRTRFSEFSYVRVADESDGYRILAGKSTGNAGDPFHTTDYEDRMQSMRFSTYDVDNDMDPHGNCALTFTSGWWFNNCFRGNLNGIWYSNGIYRGRVSNGIVWDFWKEHPQGYSLKFVEIKLRPEYF